MSVMVQELNTLAMQAAMEANFAEEMMCFGRSLLNGEVHESPELFWFYTGRPFLNSVTRTQLVRADEAYIHQKITEVCTYFAAHDTRFVWAVDAATRPTHLATSLEKRGFTKVGEDSTMAIDIHRMNENVSAPAGFTITEIEDEDALKIQRDLSVRGFGATPEGAQTYYENFVATGYGKGRPWHHYIGRLNNIPVAIASLLLHAGIAGIYGIATLPEARKQGIGAAITLYALREARTRGYRIGALVPSEMGISLYRTLGFQEMQKVSFYSWSPTPKEDKK